MLFIFLQKLLAIMLFTLYNIKVDINTNSKNTRGTEMKDLNTLLQDAKDVLEDLNIPYGKIVRCTVNYTAQRRWGRCRQVGTNEYEIEISYKLMADDIEWEAAMNTMIHELLHAYKNRMCHTGEWKRCAELVNREYPIYNIRRCSSAEERGVAETAPRYKYKVICHGCGNVCKYMRGGKAIQKIKARGSESGYHCSLCKSRDLEVEVL